MTRSPFFRICWITALTLCGLAAGGCQPSGLLPHPSSMTPAGSVSPTAVSAPQTATPDMPTPQPMPSGAPAAASNNDAPLRFVFPTPGSAPISLWRPPLVDVPFALGPYDHFYFARPIAADEVNWPLADYRYGGIFFGADIVHTGVDIDAPTGTPVLAAAAGKVVWSGYGLFSGAGNTDDPYGLAVAIRHDFGYQGQRLYTIYAHMRKLDVIAGQTVAQGDELGEVGETGKTTGPHLHFEVRLGSNTFYTTRNPELWLAPPQGWGVLVGRLMDTSGTLLYNKEVVVRNEDGTQYWSVRTYGPSAVVSDDYYHENMVLSDLPAGKYTVWVTYNGRLDETSIEINPGAITYFTYRGNYAFSSKLPSASSLDIYQTLTPAP